MLYSHILPIYTMNFVQKYYAAPLLFRTQGNNYFSTILLCRYAYYNTTILYYVCINVLYILNGVRAPIILILYILHIMLYIYIYIYLSL